MLHGLDVVLGGGARLAAAPVFAHHGTLVAALSVPAPRYFGALARAPPVSV
jgi:DNA-binding IclR family transcriptional regulator